MGTCPKGSKTTPKLGVFWVGFCCLSLNVNAMMTNSKVHVIEKEYFQLVNNYPTLHKYNASLSRERHFFFLFGLQLGFNT